MIGKRIMGHVRLTVGQMFGRYLRVINLTKAAGLQNTSSCEKESFRQSDTLLSFVLSARLHFT
jgi:hypothetical protein